MSSTYTELPSKGGSGIQTIESDSAALTVNMMGDTAMLEMHPEEMSVGESQSVVNTYTAGEDLSALKIVYMDDLTGFVFLGDHTTLTLANAVGVTKTAANQGTPVEVIQYGVLRDASFTFPSNSLLFLTVSGTISNVAPTTGYLTRIGRTITLETILINLESPVAL